MRDVVRFLTLLTEKFPVPVGVLGAHSLTLDALGGVPALRVTLVGYGIADPGRLVGDERHRTSFLVFGADLDRDPESLADEVVDLASPLGVRRTG